MKSDARRLKLFDAVFAFATIAGLGNFAYHAVQGEFGVFAGVRLEAEAESLSAELAALRAENTRMAALVTRLGPEKLDLDLLDERARSVLGYVREDEILLR